jgi:predicted site-specific integrase-resolvase
MELLKEKIVAKNLDVSVATLRRWRTKGTGPRFHKLNGAVRYASDDVRRFAESRARISTQTPATVPEPYVGGQMMTCTVERSDVCV